MATTRTRARRLEVRVSDAERDLIDRAVAVEGTDLTAFAVSNLTAAARRVLADRTEFTLDDAAASQWERINERPARDLPGLRAFMQRPSPFAE